MKWARALEVVAAVARVAWLEKVSYMADFSILPFRCRVFGYVTSTTEF